MASGYANLISIVVYRNVRCATSNYILCNATLGRAAFFAMDSGDACVIVSFGDDAVCDGVLGGKAVSFRPTGRANSVMDNIIEDFVCAGVKGDFIIAIRDAFRRDQLANLSGEAPRLIDGISIFYRFCNLTKRAIAGFVSLFYGPRRAVDIKSFMGAISILGTVNCFCCRFAFAFDYMRYAHDNNNASNRNMF